MSPAQRLQYEVELLTQAGYAVRQFALSSGDAALEARAALPKLDTYGQLRSMDGREHNVAILFVLNNDFPKGPPQVAAGVSTVQHNGSLDAEEEIEVRSTALQGWRANSSLAQIASEVIASADAAPAAHPSHSLFDEFGQIRALSGGST
jgi:hypothetical protein